MSVRDIRNLLDKLNLIEGKISSYPWTPHRDHSAKDIFLEIYNNGIDADRVSFKIDRLPTQKRAYDYTVSDDAETVTVIFGSLTKKTDKFLYEFTYNLDDIRRFNKSGFEFYFDEPPINVKTTPNPNFKAGNPLGKSNIKRQNIVIPK